MLPKSLETIVFDWDGTLVTAEPMVHEAYVATFKSLGDNRTWTPADTHARNGEDPNKIFADKTLWGENGTQARDLFYAHYKRLQAERSDLFKVKEGAVELLDFIQETYPKVKLVLLAAKTEEIMVEEVARFGLSDRFDAIVGKTSEGPNKPDKAVFDRAMKLIDVDVTNPTTEVLHIGDNPQKDEAFARDYGAASIVVHESCAIKDLLQLRADLAKHYELTKELFEAIEEGNLQQISQLVKDGADVNAVGLDGDDVTSYRQSVLIYALDEDKYKAAQLLVVRGADVNVEDILGNTPLILSVDKPVLVKLLIEKKADLNAANYMKKTALMQAVEYDLIKSVRLLTEAGADVNLADENGLTALMYSAQKGYCYPIATDYKETELIDILLDAKADINAVDNFGNTALLIAAYYQNTPYVIDHLIAKKADVNIANYDGVTPLMQLVERGEFKKTIKKMIEAGADVNMADNTGKTALMRAVESGSYDTVEMLVNSGAKLSAEDKDGRTALTIAKELDNEDLYLLLKSSAAQEKSAKPQKRKVTRKKMPFKTKSGGREMTE